MQCQLANPETGIAPDGLQKALPNLNVITRALVKGGQHIL